MKLIRLIVTVSFLVVVVLFAVGNLSDVRVGLWPFLAAIELPLVVVVFVAGLIGFLVGMVAEWLWGSKHRKRSRALADRNAALQRQLDELHRRQQMSEARAVETGDRPQLPART